jgi:hypothetical protein
MAHLVKDILDSAGYRLPWDVDLRREEVLTQALLQEKLRFSHFVTVTCPRLMSELEVIDCINRALRTIGALCRKSPDFYYTLSLSPGTQYRSIETPHPSQCDVPLQWHAHVLLGGPCRSLSADVLARAFTQQHFGKTTVSTYDHSDKLIHYVTSSANGNRIGALQCTNVRRIVSFCRKHHQNI